MNGKKVYCDLVIVLSSFKWEERSDCKKKEWEKELTFFSGKERMEWENRIRGGKERKRENGNPWLRCLCPFLGDGHSLFDSKVKTHTHSFPLLSFSSTSPLVLSLSPLFSISLYLHFLPVPVLPLSLTLNHHPRSTWREWVNSFFFPPLSSTFFVTILFSSHFLFSIFYAFKMFRSQSKRYQNLRF